MGVGAFAFALGVYAVAISSDRFSDGPLFLLVVPVAFAAMAYGLKGGILAALVGSAVATSWWIGEGYPGGVAWCGLRILTYLLVGTMLGWLIDTARALFLELEQRAGLSLEGIAIANYDGYFTHVNPAFCDLLGYEPEEITSQPFMDLVHPDDREPTLTEVARLTEAGEAVLRFENRYRHKDGSYRWFEWSSRPEPSTQTLVCVARDVTNRKALEQKERDYQSMLEQAVRERTAELRLRNAELEESRVETFQRLALAAEFRDDDTFQHTQRVGNGAALIASLLGLPDREIAVIREAAQLHDVGKLGVSDAILLKRGKLTPQEFEQVKKHADAGGRILAGSNSDVLKAAEQIARHHHEWWDGSGYPHGLEGNEIPLSARIVAIVDVFDALTHTRPYKEAWPIDRALAEIHSLRGRQFDPDIVGAFAQLDPYALAGLPATIHKQHQSQVERPFARVQGPAGS